MYQKIPEHVSCGIAPVLFQETFILNIFIISMSMSILSYSVECAS